MEERLTQVESEQSKKGGMRRWGDGRGGGEGMGKLMNEPGSSQIARAEVSKR